MLAAPEPEKPSEAREAEQAQVKAPVVAMGVGGGTANVLSCSPCRGAGACEANEEERAN